MRVLTPAYMSCFAMYVIENNLEISTFGDLIQIGSSP